MHKELHPYTECAWVVDRCWMVTNLYSCRLVIVRNVYTVRIFFVAVLARSFVSIGVMSKNGVSSSSSSLKRIVDVSVWDVDVVAIEVSSLVDATKSILCYSVWWRCWRIIVMVHAFDVILLHIRTDLVKVGIGSSLRKLIIVTFYFEYFWPILRVWSKYKTRYSQSLVVRKLTIYTSKPIIMSLFEV